MESDACCRKPSVTHYLTRLIHEGLFNMPTAVRKHSSKYLFTQQLDCIKAHAISHTSHFFTELQLFFFFVVYWWIHFLLKENGIFILFIFWSEKGLGLTFR